ncbi:MAG TPA: hypothetical protein VI322_04900 [Candidatus Saccharimonadia bacterium]
MTKQFLIVGRKMDVIEEIQQRVQVPGATLYGATTLDEVRRYLAETQINHVIMGAGIDLDTRLDIVQTIFEASDAITVHMKDRVGGAAGMLPFVAALVPTLMKYEV